jgi:hypothetical protein
MNAMLDARIVAARIQGCAFCPHGNAGFPENAAPRGDYAPRSVPSTAGHFFLEVAVLLAPTL